MKRLSALMSVLVCCVAGLPAVAEELADEVAQAYRDTQRYAAEVTYRSTLKQGRWTRSQQTTVRIAFDRDAQKLVIDRPDALVVVDGSDVLARLDGLDAVYLRRPLARRPMDETAVIEALPMFEQPAFPDVALMIAAEPWARLARGDKPIVRRAADDEKGRPQLDVVGPMGTLTLTIDPQTRRVTHGIYRFDKDANHLDDQTQMTETFTIREVVHNDELPEDAFAFDPGDRQAVESIR